MNDAVQGIEAAADSSSREVAIDAVRRGGPELAALVDERYKTRAAFSRASGVSVYDVSRYCSGSRTPGQRAVSRMCRALGLGDGMEKQVVEQAEGDLIAALDRSLRLERAHSEHLADELERQRVENRSLRARLRRVREALEEK